MLAGRAMRAFETAVHKSKRDLGGDDRGGVLPDHRKVHVAGRAIRTISTG
jgi:hypothetical protein